MERYLGDPEGIGALGRLLQNSANFILVLRRKLEDHIPNLK